jgi:hypothetical protein
MSDKYNVSNLILHAVEQRPSEFSSVFNDILLDKLQTAVANKKEEIAQKLYSNEYTQDQDYSQDNEEELDA